MEENPPVIIVKKYRAAYITNAVSLIIVYITTYIILNACSGITPTDIALVTAYFLILAGIHEISHYAVALKYNEEARIRVYPRLGALILDYVRLPYKGYVYTTIAPIITVQIPLIILWLIFNDSLILVLNLYHLAASSVDIMGLIHTTIMHRNSYLNLVYDEEGKIVGVVVEEPLKNKITFYQL